ncbi:hypothetical protein [Streptomyces sp900116325]|uniref:hypothetical protein n=1 Tax=Streptomyces sp. 900116325 TaxID=3154295 RepID=UPI0033A77E74
MGLVRADLQQRLAESIRQLERGVSDRYKAVERRLGAALEQAGTPPAEQVAETLAFSDRERLLRGILADLTELDRPAGEPSTEGGRHARE